tara:strand:- start:19261 stop:19377 length:117 start_codon:yes stop_codon:yes gene_type:complete
LEFKNKLLQTKKSLTTWSGFSKEIDLQFEVTSQRKHKN